MKIFAKTIDDKTKEQLAAITQVEPFREEKIRIMPDCHSGKGCVIGFTSTISNKVIPNVVGVDIGCGVMWDDIGRWDFGSDGLAELDAFIKERIPSGKNVRAPENGVFEFIQRLKCKGSLRNLDWICGSLGTLGGGNHFIEVDQDEEGCKYLVVHTGSRNLGKQVAEIYQAKAINNLIESPDKAFVASEIERLKAEGRQREIQPFLKRHKTEGAAKPVPEDLCWLEGQDMEDYLHDMRLCQEFAHHNRQRIMDEIFRGFFGFNHDYQFYHYESVHNYIDIDNRIARKGAIKADFGQKVIIPLNMRDGCILGTGLGNPDWNNSAPHGAGRVMSRGEARRELRLSDFQAAMAGIYTTTATQGTIDESPMAYKDASEIIGAIGDTVHVDGLIKTIYNFKAEE